MGEDTLIPSIVPEIRRRTHRKHPEETFPIPRTEYKTFYLSSETLSETTSPGSGIVTYDSEDNQAFAGFTYRFTKKTRLFGMPKAHLFMSSPSGKDMIIYLLLRKIDRNGIPQMSLNIPLSRAPVPSIHDIASKDRTSSILGILRASHRAIDREESTHEQFPYHPHDTAELVKPGKIVELEIGIWNLGVGG